MTAVDLLRAAAPALLTLVSAETAAAQCLPTDERAEGLRNYAMALVSEPGDLWQMQRRTLDVPGGSPDEVWLVDDPAVCEAASRAYAEAFDLATPPAVWVVRAGPTRYLVKNPDTRRGEFTMTAILDERFEEVTLYGS